MIWPTPSPSGKVQRFALDPARAEAIFSTIGFGACGDAFADAFDVALAAGGGPGPVLTLVPRRPELASAFERIELTLDAADALPRKIVLHETSGDSVSFELSEVERGVRIDPALFELGIPKGYSVTP
jgi:hypothetical protein